MTSEEKVTFTSELAKQDASPITVSGRIQIAQTGLVLLDWSNMVGNRNLNSSAGSGFQTPMYPAHFSIEGWGDPNRPGPGHHIYIEIADQLGKNRTIELHNPSQTEVWFDMRAGAKVSISQPQSGTLAGENLFVRYAFKVYV